MNSIERGSVANRLFFRLFQTGNTLQRQVQNEMGISTVQWAVLGALSREGYEEGISFNMLTEYLVVSRQSLDGVLKRMERDQHVLRIPHPDDGRARLVVMTEQGLAFWGQLQQRIHEFYSQGLESFGFDDIVSVLHYLNKLQLNLAGVSLNESVSASSDEQADHRN